MKVLLLILLALLPVPAVAGLARQLYRQGAFAAITQRWRRASRPARVAFALLLGGAIACGSDKDFGGATNRMMTAVGRFAGSVATNVFSSAEQTTGYALAAVGTNETHDFTMPANAVVADRIAKRGAHDDGFWTQDGGLWVQTDGTAAGRACPPYRSDLNGTDATSNLTVFAVAQGSYGFLPEALWGTYGTSRIWTAETDAGSRLVTWEGALVNRLPSDRVTFQTEFAQNGDITYRYSAFPSNAAAGLFRNGAAQTLDLATNATSASLAYIGDLT